MVGVSVEEKVDEPGAGDLDPRDRGICRQSRHQRFGQLAGILARHLRRDAWRYYWQNPRAAGRGSLDLYVGGALGRRNEVSGQRDERLAQQVLDQCLQGASVWQRAGSLPTANASIHFQGIHIDRPAQPGRPRQRFYERQPEREKALQRGACGCLDQKVRTKVIGAAGDQGACAGPSILRLAVMPSAALRPRRGGAQEGIQAGAVLRFGTQQGEPRIRRPARRATLLKGAWRRIRRSRPRSSGSAMGARERRFESRPRRGARPVRRVPRLGLWFAPGARLRENRLRTGPDPHPGSPPVLTSGK